ncbi:MAG: methyltransferase domain-containing protein [Zoogloea sp.]|uniref:methyltransferase domain-containing protein n=1 Tax=Zoogloea sp. TaxID=49181 RepID=UPI00260B4CDC|nr:methyltransferase domain-containing protein [Zoogloea sp.]MDD2989804.1 methyltransferase domain-containing protein [Zoogloea sp.]
MWRADDPQGNEAAKVRWDVVPYTRGTLIDLGCGPSKIFPHAIGVDSGKDTELFGIDMRPDVWVETCEDLSDFETEAADSVFSAHLLEHIEDYRSALKEWWRLVKVGGYLVLYLPHRQYYPNIGQPGANPDHKHDFVPADIVDAMRATLGGWDLVENQARNDGTEYSFLLVFQKTDGNRHTHSYLTRPKTNKPTACVVRYGGYGDMLQAANVLPLLKAEGFHVTVMTTPKGQDILRNDPNVDAWFIQDDNQVPNHLLPEFWAHQAKHFDRFVQLSESVEGTLLAMPGRANHAWPWQVRHTHLNQNYLEFTCELAGVAYESAARFYPTDEERVEAQARLTAAGPNFTFALAGSSVHKFYPGQDSVIARLLLEFEECRIFLVGDPSCKMLELGWENEPRVVCLSGEISIRQTLALAQQCDAVIGPETGVLNAVAFESMRKVVLLSHSSHENLTKHWTNTAALMPQGVSCYPCHQLHFDRRYCRQDEETGAAVCQRSIAPETVYEAVVL